MLRLLKSGFILFVLSLALGSVGTHVGVQAQGGDTGVGGAGATLPAADWWALVYLPGTDTLHWLNPDGEQIMMPRPELPDEVNFGFPEMHVGANGRMLVLAMPINDGDEYGLGFYDFSTGEMVRVHQTQVGEVPRVYSRYASDENSQAVAVGFAFGLNAAEEGWRVILFDLFTGDVLGQLRSDAESVQGYEDVDAITGGAIFPQPIWFEGGGGLDAGVHVRLDPIGVGDDLDVQQSSAIVWYPRGRPDSDTDTQIFRSPYNARAIDFSRLGPEAVFAYFNGALPRTEVPFVDTNAIGRGAPVDLLGYPETEFVFGTGAQAYDRVRWAGDGSQVVFRAINAAEEQRWFTVDLDGGQPQALPDSTLDVIGVPGGFLYAADGQVTLRNVPPTGAGDRVVWDTGLDDVAMQFVYATQPGLDGNLGMQSVFVPMGGESFIETVEVLQCELGLPTRLAIGDTAALTIPAGVFFVEDPETPDLAASFERLPAETTLSVVGGPLCVNGFAYWQVELDDGRRGWAPESGETDYVLATPTQAAATGTGVGSEPDAAPPATDATPAADATDTAVDGSPPPTQTAGDELPRVDDPDSCELALPTQIDSRDTVRTRQAATFYVGEAPDAIGNNAVAVEVPQGATLYTIGGPLCREGLRFWVFDWQGDDDIWRRGWVAESTDSAYIVTPADGDSAPVDVPPDELPEIGVAHCTDAPESIITIGSAGEVSTVDNVPVLLRVQPGGAQAGLVESGQNIVVLDGPECADGFPFTYWRVRVSETGLEGWMAEGDALSYFIVPAGDAATE